jgi:hypothetical protein
LGISTYGGGVLSVYFSIDDVHRTTFLEIELKQAEDVKMLYQQDTLLNRIQELVENFDAELRILRHDKFKLDIVMELTQHLLIFH